MPALPSDQVPFATAEPAALAEQDSLFARAAARSNHLFSMMGQELCRAVPEQRLLSGRTPGILLVPMNASGGSVVDYFPGMPEAWLQAVREERATLLFDHSGEGAGYIDDTGEIWHEAFASLALPPRRVVFVTQNRAFAPLYYGWCGRNGTEPATILTYDYFIKSFFHRSWKEPQRVLQQRRRLVLERQPPEREFVCLAYKPRVWRLLLLTWLLRDGLWDKGFVSFGGLERTDGRVKAGSTVWMEGGPREQVLTLPLGADRAPELERLRTMPPVTFDRNDRESLPATLPRNRILDSSSRIYARSLFSLISETDMLDYQQRITEKPFKALVQGHPFVLFGNHQALELVRAFGFRTFGDWIDEGYDAIADPSARFQAAYRAFLDFRPRAAALLRDDEGLRDVLLHNLEQAFGGVQRRFAAEIDPAFCRALARALAGEGPGPLAGAS